MLSPFDLPFFFNIANNLGQWISVWEQLGRETPTIFQVKIDSLPTYSLPTWYSSFQIICARRNPLKIILKMCYLPRFWNCIPPTVDWWLKYSPALNVANASVTSVSFVLCNRPKNRKINCNAHPCSVALLFGEFKLMQWFRYFPR